MNESTIEDLIAWLRERDPNMAVYYTLVYQQLKDTPDALIRLRQSLIARLGPMIQRDASERMATGGCE